ncbi:MAG: 2-C-methyl-D-erythritol 2,4-cyclodiphosphate synthase [Bacteroidales bacterium]|jgi:2-C-methyl-D-erythritol 2,4-cyclodiphosphate synthase
MRIGIGYDVHKLAANLPLIIGGVKIPHTSGFVAHSDGDVLIHAICDALLGALALGDIGQHFPDTDETYRGIDSKKLLAGVVQLLTNKGYEIGNIDAVIMAQRPKMAPHIPAMRKKLAEVLTISPEQISIKATTTEKLGFVGREEGIAAEAIALLKVHKS